jgi:hypothetical protein
MRTLVQKTNPSKTSASSSALPQHEAIVSNERRDHHSSLQTQASPLTVAVPEKLPSEREPVVPSPPAKSRVCCSQNFAHVPTYSSGVRGIGEPGNAYEREADQIAEQITRSGAPKLERSCACGGTCAKCETKGSDKEEHPVQAKPISSNFTGEAAVPSPVRKAQLSAGQSLDHSARNFMESRFGHDFGGVRVHSDDAAALGAAAIQARAYTIGSDIFFGAGQYAPSTLHGKRLLAHELTHVLQQSGSATARVQRKALDKCDEAKPSGSPCASWTGPAQVARLKPFSARAHEDFAASKSLNLVTRILGASLDPVEKAQLVRVACCQLNAEDAKTALQSFSNRTGHVGEIFGNFATATRCDLLAILKQRATPAPQPEKPAAAPTDVASAIKQALTGPPDKDTNRVARKALEASLPFNLKDPAVLQLASQTVSDVAGAIVMVHYLDQADHALGHRKPDEPQQDPAAVLRVHRSGPYGTYGGVMIPVIAGAVGRPFAWVLYFVESVQAFIRGIGIGLSESISLEAAEEFGKRLALSFVTTVVLAPVFLAGLAVGLADMVKGFVETIVNIKEVIKATLDLLETMFSPDGHIFAKGMGEAFGVEFGTKITEMSQMGQVRFTYELGRLVGPAVLFAVLSLLGIPEAMGAVVGTRILEILAPMAKRFPRLAKLAGKLTRTTEKIEAAVVGVEGRAAKTIEKDAAKLERDAAKAKELAAAAAEEKPLAPPRKGKGGHEVHVERDGPHVCSNHPCDLLAKMYETELKRSDVLRDRLKEANDLRLTNPEESTRLSTALQSDLEDIRAGRKPYPAPAPKGKPITAAPKTKPGAPSGYEDMPQTGSRNQKQAGVKVSEDHHLATKYGRFGARNRAVFKRGDTGIDHYENMLADFEEHGTLRGWEEEVEGSNKLEHHARGHHPEYNEWVTSALEENVPAGLDPAEAGRRIGIVLNRIRYIVAKHPDILAHGPRVLGDLAKLEFVWI